MKKYKSFEECMADNEDKGEGAAAFCSTVMKKPTIKASAPTRSNLLLSGIKLTPVTSRDNLNIDLLAATELGELMQFKGARLAKAEINKNHDEIRPRDIDMLADTLPGMAITDEHKDQVVVGYITAAHSRDGSSSLLIDGIVFAKRFPQIARDIQSGVKKLSVEADADCASCSKCNGVFANVKEYCEHLEPVSNRFTVNAYRSFPKSVKGVGAGVVKDPAGTDTGFDGNRISMVAAMDDYGGQVDPVDVHLRMATDSDRACGSCEYFNIPNNTCSRVSGFIAAGELCDLFQSRSDEEIDMTEEQLNAALASAFAPVNEKLQATENALKESLDQHKEEMQAVQTRLDKFQADYLNTPDPDGNSYGVRDLPTPSEPTGTGAKPTHVTVGKPDGLDAARTVVRRIAAVTAMVGPTVAEAVAEGISSMTAEQYDALTQIVTALRSTPQVKAGRNGAVRGDGISVLSTIAGQYNDNNEIDTLFAGINGKTPW